MVLIVASKIYIKVKEIFYDLFNFVVIFVNKFLTHLRKKIKQYDYFLKIYVIFIYINVKICSK